MTDKGLNLFDESAAECVHLCPKEKNTPLLPERKVKCTHLAT